MASLVPGCAVGFPTTHAQDPYGMLKDRGIAVSAARLWSVWPRCIESRRYPNCRLGQWTTVEVGFIELAQVDRFTA